MDFPQNNLNCYIRYENCKSSTNYVCIMIYVINEQVWQGRRKTD